MPGYMSGSKKARMSSSISNFEQMGPKFGLSPTKNISALQFRAYDGRQGSLARMPIPASEDTYAKQVAYINANKLATFNMACAGGVGRRAPFIKCHFA